MKSETYLRMSYKDTDQIGGLLKGEIDKYKHQSQAF
jgi:hypothetical protein